MCSNGPGTGSAGEVFVNLFVPSTFKTRGRLLTQRTSFPVGGDVRLDVVGGDVITQAIPSRAQHDFHGRFLWIEKVHTLDPVLTELSMSVALLVSAGDTAASDPRLDDCAFRNRHCAG